MRATLIALRRGYTRPVRARRGAALLILALIVAASAWAAIPGRMDVAFSTAKPAPNTVKKRFADLGLGAPARMAPGVLAVNGVQEKVVARLVHFDLQVRKQGSHPIDKPLNRRSVFGRRECA
jgi:hypothetical protein